MILRRTAPIVPCKEQAVRNSMFTIVCVLALQGLWTSTGVAAGPADADLAAIRASSNAFVDAFNKHDAKAVGDFASRLWKWFAEGR